MSFQLWESFKDPDKRAILSWLGGGAVVVAGGIWTVVTFVVEHKDESGKKGGTNITVGRGIASGGNTTIGGNVTIGPNKEQIEQIQKPLAEQLATKDAQLAALTKMLLEKNPAAGPGAQQAIGAAVQSITQGAAEGDARLQQALDLLKANKIADATRLLNAVAEDKTARAGQETAQAAKERKEAAIAYRNLGAIARLRDPKRALEAYEKAVALDPDDLDSLFWTGVIQIDYGDLNDAQARLERVLKLAETADRSVYKYRALTGLGDIRNKRGDLKAALKSYQDGLAIVAALAKSDPGKADWQRDLSISYDRVGDVQMAQGDLKGALKSYYSSSLALANSGPSNAGLQRDLFVSFNKVGDVQVVQHDLKGALKSYEVGLTIIERLAKSDHGNASWQRDLSVSYSNIGDVQMAQDDLKGALKSYNDSLAIRERLAISDLGNAEWQRDLSVSYNNIGDVQKEQDDLKGALKSHSDSLVIAERLAKSDPGNAEWQRDLSVSFNAVGNVQLAQGDLKGALKSYNDSLAIAERLAKSDPGNAGWQRDLAVSYAKHADVLRQSGDNAKARDFLRQGQAIMARLTKLSPDNATWKQDLAEFNWLITEIAKRQGLSRMPARNPNLRP